MISVNKESEEMLEKAKLELGRFNSDFNLESLSQQETVDFIVEVLKKSEESPTLKNLLLCNEDFTSWIIEFSNESWLYGFKRRSSIMEKSHNFTHTFEWNIDYPL